MTANEEIGTFVRCYWKDGNTYTDFPKECYDRLILCVTGRTAAPYLTMNSVLDIETVFRTDRIAMVYLSTPEARRLSYQRDELWKREAEEMEKPEWA